MKTLRIYKRTILEITGFKKYPFKEAEQITIIYDGKKISNHYEDINNPRLKIKFELVLDTRKKQVVKEFYKKLGRSDTDKFVKSILVNKLNLVEEK